MPCKKFRTLNIINKLKKHFKECWSFEKHKSIKLNLFYDSYKTSFIKEPYLDLVTNPAFKYRTTRLRISSHDFEIEKGRYNNTPRELRHCKWCKVSLGEHIVENEDHVLYFCDLYSKHRSDIVNNLCKLPEFIKSFPLLQPGCHNSDEIIRDILSKVIPPEFISTISLPIIIRYLQSLDVYSSITEIPDDSDLHSYLYTFAYHLHPPLHLHQTRTDLTNEDKNTFDKIWASIRKYVQNVISSYIGRCFDQRWKFFKDLDKQPSSKL